MAYGQVLFIILVHATKYPNVSINYMVLVEGKGSTTRFIQSYKLENEGENPEYL